MSTVNVSEFAPTFALPMIKSNVKGNAKSEEELKSNISPSPWYRCEEPNERDLKEKKTPLTNLLLRNFQFCRHFLSNLRS